VRWRTANRRISLVATCVKLLVVVVTAVNAANAHPWRIEQPHASLVHVSVPWDHLPDHDEPDANALPDVPVGPNPLDPSDVSVGPSDGFVDLVLTA
jgi:hypothetical protein